MKTGMDQFRISLLLLLFGLQFFMIPFGFAQNEVSNETPPGGSLLILLMGLGAIFLVGLTFFVRERMSGMNRRDNGSN